MSVINKYQFSISHFYLFSKTNKKIDTNICLKKDNNNNE